MSVLAGFCEKVVDALGATAHALSWVLVVLECVLAGAGALAGGVLAWEGAGWGWTVSTGCGAWLTGLVVGWWRPLTWRPVFSWWT